MKKEESPTGNPVRTWYIAKGENHAGFELADDQAHIPENLSGTILASLWDIAAKYGYCTAQGIEFCWSSEDTDLSIAIEVIHPVSPDGPGGMKVVRYRQKTGAYIIERPSLIRLTNDMLVVWESTVSTDQAWRAIQEIDNQAETEGKLINGIRIAQPLPDPVGTPTFWWEDQLAVVALPVTFLPFSGDTINLDQLMEPGGKIGRILLDHGLVPPGTQNWTRSLPTAHEYDLEQVPLPSGGRFLHFFFSVPER